MVESGGTDAWRDDTALMPIGAQPLAFIYQRDDFFPPS